MSSSGAEDVRRGGSHLDRPLADTWGCSLRGHVEQLAELAANAVVMLVEASRIFNSATNHGDEP